MSYQLLEQDGKDYRGHNRQNANWDCWIYRPAVVSDLYGFYYPGQEVHTFHSPKWDRMAQPMGQAHTLAQPATREITCFQWNALWKWRCNQTCESKSWAEARL